MTAPRTIAHSGKEEISAALERYSGFAPSLGPEKQAQSLGVPYSEQRSLRIPFQGSLTPVWFESQLRVMKAQGMTEAQIIPELPRLAAEAVRFLAAKVGVRVRAIP